MAAAGPPMPAPTMMERQFLGFLMLLYRCMMTDGVGLLICINCPICAYTAEEPIMENEVRF